MGRDGRAHEERPERMLSKPRAVVIVLLDLLIGPMAVLKFLLVWTVFLGGDMAAGSPLVKEAFDLPLWMLICPTLVAWVFVIRVEMFPMIRAARATGDRDR